MSTEIISPSYITPGAFAQVNVAMGPGTAAIGEREVVLVGPKLSTGTYTAASLYQVDRLDDVKTGAGAGSPLHRAARRFLMGNRVTKLWVLPVAETSGAGSVAALTIIVVTANVTAAGWAEIWICGEQFRYVYGLTDTATTIGDGLAALINGATHLPVTAVNITGSITITAKLKGISQNNTIRWRTNVAPSTGVSFGTTSGYIGSTTPGAEGSTTEAANLATALSTLDADAEYFIGITECDSTSIGNLVTHLAACAQPLVGLRKRGFVGFNGSKSSAATLAVARNYERLHMVWQDTGPHDSAELMAGVLAVYALNENVDPSWAPVGYRKVDFTLLPAFAQSDWPTGAEISDALSSGLIPICSDKNGAYIADGVTTRSKDATKAYNDFRGLYSERISMGDALAARCVNTWVLRYQGKKLDTDETLANGSVNANQLYNSATVKPSQARDMIAEILTQASADKEIVNLSKSLASLSAAPSSSNSQRLVCSFDFETIGYARQATFSANEVSR